MPLLSVVNGILEYIECAHRNIVSLHCVRELFDQFGGQEVVIGCANNMSGLCICISLLSF